MSGISVEQIVRDHGELRNALHDFSVQVTGEIKEVSGKVDTAIALLANVRERQNKSDDRTEKLEAEIRRLQEKSAEQREADRKEADRKIESLTRKVNYFSGGITLFAFALPVITSVILRFFP